MKLTSQSQKENDQSVQPLHSSKKIPEMFSGDFMKLLLNSD